MTDERICEPLRQLLGEDYIWVGGPGGGLYVGDTQWHPDVAHVGDGKQTRLKAGLYLDPVRKETGCLRVVPGSHRNPLHDELQPMRMGRLKKAIDEGSLISNIAPASEADKKELSDWEEATGIDLDNNNTIYGTDPLDIPSAALESDPGDVVFFKTSSSSTRHSGVELAVGWSPTHGHRHPLHRSTSRGRTPVI